MPKEVVPITGLDQIGVIADSPPVSLPPNAFSDVRNVRFKDGAVRKMEGEVNIFPNIFDDVAAGLSFDGSILKYVVWWPNPNIIDENRGYYLIIREEANFVDPATSENLGNRDVAYLTSPGSTTLSMKGHFTPDTLANWQHTFFQGGFALVINNGLDAPHFILDTDGNDNVGLIADFAVLPGWESYNVNQISIVDTFNANTDSRTFDIGTTVDFSNFNIQAILTDAMGVTNTLRWANTADAPMGATYADVAGAARITFPESVLATGTQVNITVSSNEPVLVRAGVIRSFGDFLVAGNLTEFTRATEDGASFDTVIRNLAGIVRTSDVAAPGEVPSNWNPFASGVSTADEFILTATGVVQDMVELQGSFYIYSNSSISIMRQTGNPQVPLSVAPLTDSYGAQTTDVVQEFDGKHFVIGTQDLYVFGGHPGSIQSVADTRVRRFFFDNLNPLHNQRMFTLRYSQRDEIWVCYPTTASVRGECDQALIWNYRQNNWTIRVLSSAVAGDIGPVPGGGLPTSTNGFSGNAGSNELIQAGIREQQTLQFPMAIGQIQNGHPGIPSRYNIEVQGLQDFTSVAASFSLALTDQFDTGPNYGPDLVSFRTPAVDLRSQLLMSSDTRADVTIELPRYLTSDKNFSETRTYLAGNGVPGEAGYYPGQRVLANNNLGVPTVYRVLNGFGDGSVPATFYDPNEQGPFYTLEQNLIYQDTQDIVGVEPRHLIVNAPYGTVPGDNGTGNAITATQARWEDLGPASTQGRSVGDVVNLFQSALRSSTAFNEFFNTRDVADDANSLIIEARGSSGVNGFPTYRGVSFELGFPDINPMQADETNGGDISAMALTVAPAESSLTTEGAVVFQATVTENQYVPFSADDVANTGRYAVNPDAPVLDRIAVTFNGTFTGANINTEIAGILREGIMRDPTEFWTVTPSTDQNIALASRSNGNFNIAIEVPPATDPITPANFVVTTMGERGQRPTDGSPNAIAPEPPVFRLVPPAGDTGEVIRYVSPPITGGTVNDRGVLMEEVVSAAFGMGNQYPNWEFVSRADDVVTIQSRAAPEGSMLPPPLRQAERPANGTWTVELVAPGNTINTTLGTPTATSIETTEGRFSASTTPSYMGILVSNPSIPDSRLEFLLLEAVAPMTMAASAVVDKWISQIRAAIPRIAVQRRGSGFFLQPANYDDLANFVLDVRINDNPANAHWIYEIVTNGTNPETMVSGIALNSASDTPLFINGGEAGHMYDPDAIPLPTATTYPRSGGPLKIAQVLMGSTVEAATLSNDAVTTLVFDIFRPWPRDEINQNLEFPIFATVFLDQDDQGIFRNLNKVVGADIGWSKPSYLRTRRATTPDTANFTETINPMTDDFPRAYESYVERVQLAIQPEFDTEQLASLALWADGSTPEFLRGNIMHNQLDVRVVTTNNPGEITSLGGPGGTRPPMNGPNGISNLFNVSTDYKIDMRQHGRFMNYRITDGFTLDTTADNNPTHQAEWRLSGMQADVMKGGTR